jgi:hypothetical protein
MTFGFVLYFLVPVGFNIVYSEANVMNYLHGVFGCALLGFVVIQVITGMVARFCQLNEVIDILKIINIKKFHRYLGYAMAIVYKIDILY